MIIEEFPLIQFFCVAEQAVCDFRAINNGVIAGKLKTSEANSLPGRYFKGGVSFEVAGQFLNQGFLKCFKG